MPDRSTAEAKYAEYKQKLAAWERLFEEEYGSPPSDDDCHGSSTWVALNDKAKFYKKILSGGGESFKKGGGDKSMRRGKSTVRRSASTSPTRQPHSREQSFKDKGASYERGHSSAHGMRSTSTRRRDASPSPAAARSGGGGRDEGHSMRRPPKSRRDRSKSTGHGSRSANSKRHISTTDAPVLGRREDGAQSGELAPLPRPSAELMANDDYASIYAKAETALEKLRERAFERDYGEAPTASDKGVQHVVDVLAPLSTVLAQMDRSAATAATAAAAAVAAAVATAARPHRRCVGRR